MNQIQVNTPRVMFAAMRSGSGKTTVTCGVLAALKKQNIKVQAYKCGPDYIDPMFHRTVLGIDTGIWTRSSRGLMRLDIFWCVTCGMQKCA